MAKLLYKTRGMSEPKGKPKVYFTGHPKDFGPYFESIAEEILYYQNCAIWYDEEPEADYEEEELLADLSGMQLIVMPVTSRFLYEENRARLVEFPYAMEHHIPVLPLVQEPGLSSEFNRICGSLQLLDKCDRDATAIRYEEKLSNFLSAVLVNDETAEHVRAAFDAYVFLSYRKKDRKYANELMRLIHQNEFCRDIAIWYDEYLVPGENFNNAIRDAMEKSELFTLLVTPNLVNENNYVMRVEYPAAKDAGMPVMPVEMQSTDAAQLKEKYDGIPDCVDPGDQAQMAKALAENLKSIAIRENDTDAQHLFFIGLAYLNGIDVEVDHERGVSLIRTAAETGLEQAVEKLVDMFRTGEGVERDYAEAIRWQEKLVAAREEVYAKDRSESACDQLAEAILELGDYQGEQDRHEEEKALLVRAEALCDEWLGEHPKENAGPVQRRRTVVCGKLGEVCQLMGCLDEAGEYFQKQTDYMKEIYGDAEINGENVRYVVKTLQKIGWFYRAKQDLERAFALERKAVDYLEAANTQVQEESGRLFLTRELGNGYSALGVLSFDMGKKEEAKAYYRKAVQVCEASTGEFRDADIGRILADAYAYLGEVLQSDQQYGDAVQCFEKSLQLYEKLAEETQMPKMRENLTSTRRILGSIHESAGDILRKEQDYDKAWESLSKAAAIYASLAQETPQDMWDCSNLAKCYRSMGMVLFAQGESEEGLKYWRSAYGIWRELQEAYPEEKYFPTIADAVMEAAESMFGKEVAAQMVGGQNKRRGFWERIKKWKKDDE